MYATISVVIPCYQQGRFLGDCIRSLQAQTYPDWEAVIIDDGSVDETRSVVDELMLRDSRVRYVHQANKGPASARNHGLSLARGSWIQFLDGDDLLLPTKFERQLAVLCAAPPPAFSYTDYWHGAAEDPLRRVNAGRLPCRFTSDDPLLDLARDWETALSIPIHAPLVDAAFFRQLGIRFDESLRNHEDWDVWMKVLANASQIKFVDEELAIYRVCSGSNSRNSESNWQGFKRAIASQMRYNEDRPDVVESLRYKARLTDWSYSKGWRFKTHSALAKFNPYTRAVPWRIQCGVHKLLAPLKPAGQRESKAVPSSGGKG
jgi:glycosyltransferase involved in cell wall biosynthesis